MLVWRALGEERDGLVHDSLVVADVVDDSLAVPDTVTTASGYVNFYSAAASPTHEWVAVYDPEYAFTKIAQRARGAPWRLDFLQAQSGALGVSLAPLTDSTALLVTAGGRIRRNVISPTSVTEETPDLAESGFAVSALRPDGAGGHWVAWTSGDESVLIARRSSTGAWSGPDTLTADYVPPSPYQLTNSIAISEDLGPRPALAWMAYGQSGVEYIYVSWPTATGWTRGEQLPGSATGGAPQLTCDENGDLWIGWWRYFEGILWKHTYTTVTCERPDVGEDSGRPLVQWSLSGPAPSTWWAVMRAIDGGAFERIARVQAGSGVAMKWADTAAPSHHELTYAIRRECRDTRYQLTTSPAMWEPKGAGLVLAVRSRNPAEAFIESEVVGADRGELELRLYDLQGRVVAERATTVLGAGRDVVRLSIGDSVHSGLYMLRARSADGRSSPTVKVAVIK
jgi:hypothetical protein